ncbi:putative phage holin [Escherichia coli MP021017.11]|nr:putative phage holin [Escherichia coli MP021017.11]ENB23303.1 putative phage holin [Escherichia coli BCE008_MS-01]
MSEPLSGSGTAAALGGATVFGLFTGMDFGIVFGAFAGALFVATMPQSLSVWRVVAHFLVSFIVGCWERVCCQPGLHQKQGMTVHQQMRFARCWSRWCR